MCGCKSSTSGSKCNTDPYHNTDTAGANSGNSNRRLDNKFNIFEGLFSNWFFIGISLIMCGGQVIIIFFGGAAFAIGAGGQSSTLWGTAIVLGFLSIPIGVVIRLIPDSLVEKLIPEVVKRRAQPKVPGVMISDDDERFHHFPAEFSDIRDELVWLKRFKGGRVNNLKFAMTNPKEVFKPRRSGSRRHSRQDSQANSNDLPQTPTRENSFGSSGGGGGLAGSATPDSRKRSRSMRSRSRSNSALGAATLMTGIVAGSIGAGGWSPIDRTGDWQQFPAAKPSTSRLSATSRANADEEREGGGA